MFPVLLHKRLTIQHPAAWIVLALTLMLAWALTPTTSLAQGACGTQYTVQRGDNLYRIAERCGTTVPALIDANIQINNPDRLEVGQVLTIPAANERPPFVALSPLSGPPGTQVRLIANGFPIDRDVVIGLGVDGSEFSESYSAQTNVNGVLDVTVPIPSYAQNGSRWVAVVQTADGRFRAESFVFLVRSQAAPTPVPPATPPPSGTLFSNAQIYLTAVGDGGQSGALIGCNDSVVPHRVNFSPTVAPLTSALNAMFSSDSFYFPGTNLYNVFYQSDLAVQGIDIENGTAFISLTGNLLLSGACDSPRVRAQIEQTALQFSTINSVIITLNGQPLDQVLSGAGF